MTGYVRQSIAKILNGLEITAPPLNAEFNRIAAAFDGGTGHTHDGSSGNSPQIPLGTSVDGYLLPDNGGTGGKNKTDAAAAPTITDDADSNYAPGSLWLNNANGRVYMCVGSTPGAAVWREVAQVTESNVFFPATNDTVDLGTAANRFRNLYLSGDIEAAGDVNVTGAVTATGGFVGDLAGNVTGDLTGNVSGNVTAAAGTSIFANITINGTADFTNTKLSNVSAPTLDSDGATKGYVDAQIAAVLDTAPGTLDTLNELAAALGDDPDFATTISDTVATKLPKAGGTMTGDIAMGGNKVTGLPAPSVGSDAVTLTYVTTLYGSTSSAAVSAALAEDWAEEAVDVQVVAGKYSAKHHATKASQSASAASTSAGNALSSETAAQQSEDAAATYAGNSSDSADASAASAAAAATSEGNAATSETNAANSAAAAATSEGNAATSETNSADSATASAASAAAALASEQASATSETNASDSATASAASAAEALTSETNAAASAIEANTYANSLDLGAIAATLAVDPVDIFVYDTTEDSDGGAWRYKCQHTSWYNEPLNTATRGSRKEFPSVAVIVAESDRVVIYDGDDPALPMWRAWTSQGLTNVTAVAATNGIVGYSEGQVNGLFRYDYAGDRWFLNKQSKNERVAAPITSTVESLQYTGSPNLLASDKGNDVAMTVLPDAPIDPVTGLKVPTIAVAMDGGLSFIHPDGSIAAVTANDVGGGVWASVAFLEDGFVAATTDFSNAAGHRYCHIFPVPATDSGVGTYSSMGGIDTEYYSSENGTVRLAPVSGKNNQFTGGMVETTDRLIFGVGNGYNANHKGLTSLFRQPKDYEGSMVAYQTSSYFSGILPGDIKGAWLADTDATNIGTPVVNLVTNGTFDTDLSGWIIGGSGVTWESGAARIADIGGSDSNIQQYVATTPGKVYEVSFDITATNSASYSDFRARLGNTADSNSIGDIFYGGASEVGSHRFTFQAEDASTRVTFLASGTDTYTKVDNVYVKEVAEKATNGDFSFWQGSAPKYWTASASVDGLTPTDANNYVEDAGRAVRFISDGNDFTNIRQQCLITGKSYWVTFDIVERTSGGVKMDSIANGSVNGIVDNVATVGTHSFFFTAKSATFIIGRTNGSPTDIVIDNLSIREAGEPDRSVNAKGLAIHGEITKTPVATGAELVAYSGFSANNYLEQPYNPNLDFGTGDFCFMGWMRRLDNGVTMFAVGDGGADDFIVQYQTGVNAGYLGGTFTPTIAVGTDWVFVAARRIAGYLNISVNGGEAVSCPDTKDWNTRWTNRTLRVGLRTAGTVPFIGDLALCRVSATVPSDDQLRYIYEQEKAAFQDGAAITIDGDSDAVVALANEPLTDLLHVGTSYGRSTFQGLRRVDQNATPVTAAIAAHNGLILEH